MCTCTDHRRSVILLSEHAMPVVTIRSTRGVGEGRAGHGPTSFGKMDFRQRAIAATSGLGIDD